MRFLLALLVYFQAEVAHAYPETIRGQYQSCASCHVSPSGGGALHNYGRLTSEDFASFTDESSGQPFFGLAPLPDWLVLGGDTRYVDIRTKGGGHTAFTMQNDFELALRLSPEVWVSANYGQYGPNGTKQYRRNYVLWQPREWVHVRVGHFTPSYGINFPDHTIATRQGLGFGSSGAETYSAELGLHSDLGDLTLTSMSRDGTTVELETPGYRATQIGSGVASRLAVNLGKSAQIGASYMAQGDEPESYTQSAGAFVSWGITRDLYLLSEGDRVVFGDEHIDLSYTELGYEALRGFHVLLTHEYQAANVPGVTLQWFPFPHVELLARARYQADQWVGVFMAHFNW